MHLVIVATAGSSSVAVAVSVVATLVLVGLVVALVSVIRAARTLQRVATELGEESHRLLTELGGTLQDAHVELDRVDDLVEEAEGLHETLTAASHAAYLTVASPLIKLLALRRGTARAAEHWQSRRSGLRSRHWVGLKVVTHRPNRPRRPNRLTRANRDTRIERRAAPRGG